MSQTGLIGLAQAIPIILGANIAKTTLSLLVSSRMDIFLKEQLLLTFYSIF